MGKFSKALEKAGYNNSDESVTGRHLDQEVLQEKEQETPPVVIGVENQDRHNDTAIKTASIGEKSLSGASGQWDARLHKAVSEDYHLPEIFKTLRSRILYPKEEAKIIRTVMITSAIPKDGKSFVAANLGISFAQGMDQHSLLVDCDLRKPTLATMFGMRADYGLVDYLQERKPLPSLIGKTSMKKLSILGAGRPPLNPAELVSSSRMHDLVQELSTRYEDRMIIFDSPPVLVAAESRVLAGQVDGVILVVRQGAAGKGQIQKVLDAIGTENIIGIVFNDYNVTLFERAYMSGYGYYQQKTN